MSYNRFLLAVYRGLGKCYRSVDSLDLPLLRVISPQSKRRLVRATYRALAPLWREKPTVLEGFRLVIPRPLARQYAAGFELQVCQYMDRFLREGMRAADVGGSIGYHTVRMARLVGETGSVVTFEPAPDSFRLLSANVCLNRFRNVRLLPYAAGDREGWRLLHHEPSSGRNSFYEPSLRCQTQVETRRFDDLIQESIDFIKLDVEGAEIEALAGMERTLRCSPGIELIVEWSPSAQEAAGHHPCDLPRLLLENGFHLQIFGHRRRLIEPHLLPELTEDLFERRRRGRVNLHASRTLPAIGI